jgi:hypothetical protein
MLRKPIYAVIRQRHGLAICLPGGFRPPIRTGKVRAAKIDDRWDISCLLGGERGGNRTHDPLIKSQMLYLLSYAL